MKKSWECNVQHSDYSSKYYIIYLKVARRVDFKCSHHTHKHTRTNYNCEEMAVLTNLIVVIILQYKCVSDHHILCLKLTQYYRSIIPQ